MSDKVFKLVAGIITGVETVAVAVVTFIAPPAMVAINAAIPLVGNCAIAVCKLFVKEEGKA